MSMEPYSDTVRQLFAAPAHVGSLDDGAISSVHDPGVSVQLFGTVVDGAIDALRFRAWGCPHFIAAAEALCATYEGRPAAELAEFAAGELMQSLPVPVEKTGRILVLEDAARSLGSELREASHTPEQKT